MAKAKKPKWTSSEEKIKFGFNLQIIKEYENEVKIKIKEEKFANIADSLMWEDLGKTLELSYHAQRRYLKGIDKHGLQPVSILDGEPERYEPGFEEIFRYIAAIDLAIALPRGRLIVNRAIAKALRYLRKIHCGQRFPLEACEVDQIRFLQRWKGPVTLRTLEAMNEPMPLPAFWNDAIDDSKYKIISTPLVESIICSEDSVRKLDDLWLVWSPFFEDLMVILSYSWVI